MEAITDIQSFWNYLEQYICSRYPGITPYSFTEEQLKEIEKLRDEKYALENWNFGTSPSYSFSKTAKLTGGIVELYMSVEKGTIKALDIMGDYFFTLPTEEFCNRMIGTQHTPEAVMEAIIQIGDTNGYFSNTSANEIAGMFFQ